MNVLKSCVKFAFISVVLVTLWPRSVAATTEQTLSRSPVNESLLPMLFALIAMLLVIFGIAWLAKKFNLTPHGSTHFKLISSMSLGGRERIVIIELQGQQHAIGVTSQSVNYLFELPKGLDTEPKPSSQMALDNGLVNKLNKMFGYTPPNKNTNNESNSQ